MLLGKIFLIYLLFFRVQMFAVLLRVTSFCFILSIFLYLVNDVLLTFKHIKYSTPTFITRYSSYIFELFVNLYISITLNIINNHFVTFFECRLDQILGRQGSKAKDVYESKLSLASRIVKTERQVIIPI